MTEAVWPHDHCTEPDEPAAENAHRLSCFVICPSEPRELFDGIFGLIRQVCSQLAQHLGIEVECRRAVDITSAGIIHPEIWNAIKSSDIIVADISGQNGNVMMELGVAAAWHKKEQVVILRQDRPEEKRLFDILPARQIDYSLTPQGFSALHRSLFVTIQDGFAAAPFQRVAPPHLDVPVHLDFRAGASPRCLWGPGMAHRRMVRDDYFEFGSLYNFRHSWVALADVRLQNVRVRADLRFSSPRRTPDHQPWIGIMLRSQGYLANCGHLVYLRGDGTVWVTLERDGGSRHDDQEIGRIEDFDLAAGGFVPFDVSMSESDWTVQAGSVKWSHPVDTLPYVFGEGRILIQGFFTWVGLRDIEVVPL